MAAAAAGCHSVAQAQGTVEYSADAVERATGVRPPLPPHLSDLYDRDERYDVLPNDVAAIQDYIRERISVGQVRGSAT